MARKKLTPEQWEEITKRYIINGESLRSIAKDYGVDHKTILNYLKSKDCERAKKSGENDSPQNSPNKMEAITNTAISLIDLARSSLDSESDVRVSLELASVRMSIKSRISNVSNDLLEVAIEISENLRQNKRKLIKDGSIDFDALRQVDIAAGTINKLSYNGNEAEKRDKSVEKESNEIVVYGGFQEQLK